MEYSLAKQLKGAGWDFRPTYDWQECVFEDDQLNDLGEQKIVRMPLLSELIEACGERIEGIFRVGPYWYANDRDPGERTTEGKTPEESVARLWLEINKK